MVETMVNMNSGEALKIVGHVLTKGEVPSHILGANAHGDDAMTAMGFAKEAIGAN